MEKFSCKTLISKPRGLEIVKYSFLGTYMYILENGNNLTLSDISVAYYTLSINFKLSEGCKDVSNTLPCRHYKHHSYFPIVYLRSAIIQHNFADLLYHKSIVLYILCQYEYPDTAIAVINTCVSLFRCSASLCLWLATLLSLLLSLRFAFFISISLHRRVYLDGAEMTNSCTRITHFSIHHCNANHLTKEYWFDVTMLNNNENEISNSIQIKCGKM